MEKERKIEYLSKVLILLATIIWGSSFFILKNTIDILPPLFVIAIRFSIGTFLLGLIFIKKTVKIKWNAVWKGALMGIALGLAYLLQTLGLKYTTPSKNAFLTATYCVIVPFLVWAFMRKKPTFLNLITSIICLVGIGFISLNGAFRMGLGDGLTLCSSVFFALQLVVIAKYVGKEDGIQLLIIQFLVCSILCWIASLIMELPNYPTSIPKEAIIPVLYLSVVCTVMAQGFQLFGQKHTKPSQAGLILSLEAVFGTIFSVLFYKEIITTKMFIGFSLVFISLIISETQLKKTRGLIKKLISKTKYKDNQNIIDDEVENENK